MTESVKEIYPINIEDELENSYLDYSMSVIVGRALPDVRDGLKPVHRRVLFAMHELNNDWNKAYKKSARIVGDVIGKYHPHGESAVYDAIVRLAQPFSMRYTLIDGQGNFGSVDGDSAAAMRYTEIRMKKITHDIISDLDKETVSFTPNYDGSEQMPSVMPTRIPNLLINGSSGIAVGMATNIPPHNINEIINGCLALLDNDQLTIDDLMEFIPGPDFPTAAIINGRAGIVEAYKTGKGRIYLKARATIENKENREKIIIHEIPYQVNKARLIEKIADLVRHKKIEGISELRDESDKDGMRVVIEIKRSDNADVVLNNLYSQTQLESVFGINCVALDNGNPKLMNLKELLTAFLLHRREIVTRRTVYELKKARARGHIVEGLAVALSSIDEVIAMIKASSSAQEAQEKLINAPWLAGYVLTMSENESTDICRSNDIPEQYGLKNEKYFLSPEQAKAILEMRLHRLTGLEIEKLINEYKNILIQIKNLLEILSNRQMLIEVIRKELQEVKNEYADERKTEIIQSRLDFTVEDLITEEDMVVTLSNSGYIKTTTLDTYQTQKRGGRGKAAASVKSEDYVEYLFVANTHTQILCFSTKGKVYWLKVYEIPESGRTSRGRPIVNLLPLEENESISAMLPVNEYKKDNFVFMATMKGIVKKTPLEKFSRPRSSGLIALNLDEDDCLVGANITNGTQQIMLLSNAGKAVRFDETNVRDVGRTARGVRGMLLKKDEIIISLVIPDKNKQILTISENGYGKRSHVEDFRLTKRGARGVISMKCTERNGYIVGAIQVQEGDGILLISDQGTMVRTTVNDISIMSRNTQGVRLIRIYNQEKLVSIALVDEPDDKDIEIMDESDDKDIEIMDESDDKDIEIMDEPGNKDI